jgi:signal transduction histidine kinase
MRRNFVVNLAFITYVGLSCAGYEYVRAYALDRMETALDEARRANKNLKRAIKVKERFLANVSHGTCVSCRWSCRVVCTTNAATLGFVCAELRTPMHGILSTVEDMVHTTKVRRSHKLREAVTLIADCSDHLCTVINDILDFQTLDTDQIRLERLPFDIVEQIEQVRPLLITMMVTMAVLFGV